MIIQNQSIYLGKSEENQWLKLKYANRHGLIAGATGTGKTVTLQGLAEGFSSAGVPVFIADVKGDLSGLSAAGQAKEPLVNRAKEIGFELHYQAFPVMFWDMFGKKGHPIRTTVSEMGPLLLSRLLGLNATQEGVLNIAFAVADEEGLLLLDLDDLRAVLNHVSDNAEEYEAYYGRVASVSVAAIHRALLVLEQQGGTQLFGEPALNIYDFMQTAPNGQGAINILAADKLMESPKLYSSFMLWLLSELFEELPEVGDLEQPKLVFFFDEAHLLFDEAPKALLEKIEQLVKLIRSKGVGVYFITQNPADIPDEVLAQLANRMQHALRAYTPKEQKGVKAAAQSFRPNPAFDTQEAITQLGIGEALVSVLEKKGVPAIVERTLIRPPLSLLGMVTDEERTKIIAASPIAGKYEAIVNRESAYEILTERAQGNATRIDENIWGTVTRTTGMGENRPDEAGTTRESRPRRSMPSRTAKRSNGRKSDSLLTTITKSVARSVGSQLGRQIVRGLMKSMLK